LPAIFVNHPTWVMFRWRPLSGNSDGSWWWSPGCRVWLHWAVFVICIGWRHRTHLQRYDTPAHQQTAGTWRRNIQGNTRFYRAMLRRAWLCHSILSVCPSIHPSVCL